MKKNYRKNRGSGGRNSGPNKANIIKNRDKYIDLARNARSQGERIDAEYYNQHVEHFTRVLNEILANEPKQKPPENKSQTQEKSEKSESESTENSEEPKAEIIEISASEKDANKQQNAA